MKSVKSIKYIKAIKRMYGSSMIVFVGGFVAGVLCVSMTYALQVLGISNSVLVMKSIFITSGGVAPESGSVLMSFNADDNGTVYIAHRMGIGTDTPQQALHVDGTMLVDGRLGINISTPQYPLDVFGSVHVDGSVRFPALGQDFSSTPRNMLVIDGSGSVKEKTFTGIMSWLTGDTGFAQWVQDQWEDPYWTTGSSTGIVTRTSFTRVGIGVSDPQAPLHIAGDVRLDDVPVFTGVEDVHGDFRFLTVDGSGNVVLATLSGCVP